LIGTATTDEMDGLGDPDSLVGLGGDDMVLKGGRGNDGLEEQPADGEWTRPSVTV
jgi:hypothetical protein